MRFYERCWSLEELVDDEGERSHISVADNDPVFLWVKLTQKHVKKHPKYP